MSIKRVCALLLCAILITSFVGCGAKTDSKDTSNPKEVKKENTDKDKKKDAPKEEQKQDEKEKLDPVNLVVYMLGDAPKDKDMVLDKLNELTKRDLNCTVDIKQTTWTDWQTKYSLLLTTGEKIDLITTHTWCDYFKYANQGAYMALDEMLPKYAPETWSKIPESAWKDCTVNGKIYTVPYNFNEFTQHNIIYRDDLRKKYGLDEIKTLDDMYKFFDMVAKNEPNIKPYNSTLSQLFLAPSPMIPLASVDFIAAKDYDNPRDLQLIPFTETYKKGIEKNRESFKKGYWSESILSNSVGPGEDFKNGLTAAITHNLMTAKGVAEDTSVSHPDWDVKYFIFTNKEKIFPVVSNSNGMSIPLSASNPERALMLLEKLRNDKEYYDLTQYGIRGVHYEENEKGEFMLPEGVTETGFPVEGFCSWSWRTNEFWKLKANGWSDFEKINNEYKSVAKANIFDAFYFDPYPIQAELAAINNVVEQYGSPLEAGLVEPEEGLTIYQQKLKEAGCDTVLEEVKKQFNAYLDARGIK